MNETRVTIHGNVVTEPVVRETRTGGVFTTFRIATTPFSRTADGKFADGETSFYGVIAFNALGANIGASLRKGQPVVVEGKLSTREWQGADGQLRQSTEIDAEHVGHDLAWGRSRFERLSKAAALGHDRLSEPEVADALQSMAEASDQRPAGVDENGVVDGDLYPAAALQTGDPETDDYEVVDQLSA
ncbi:MAG: single-stranded DNA-binding protein [Humibacillus sp.]|nr:single-stranded DNA-binding protein [Humibacillus sp.]MDN5779759.1 single-stranded DNA-binding protein [Humibacillus sp.]